MCHRLGPINAVRVSCNGSKIGMLSSRIDGMFSSMWTMMNVRNPRPELVESQPLTNAGSVIVEGSPADRWTLHD